MFISFESQGDKEINLQLDERQAGVHIIHMICLKCPPLHDPFFTSPNLMLLLLFHIAVVNPSFCLSKYVRNDRNLAFSEKIVDRDSS